MRSGEDPYLQHYYGIDFDARNLTPITKANADHTVAFSADLAFYVDNYSRTDLPNIMELYLFVAKGRDGKTDIWGLIVRPLNLDPAKKYPVVENNYAGPRGSFVPKTLWPFGFQSGGDKMIGMRSMANRASSSAAKYPWYEARRVGIYGGSAGATGYSAGASISSGVLSGRSCLRGLLRQPDG